MVVWAAEPAPSFLDCSTPVLVIKDGLLEKTKWSPGQKETRGTWGGKWLTHRPPLGKDPKPFQQQPRCTFGGTGVTN